MKKEVIARAWKDPEFRARLSEEQRASLPECPSGTPMSELGESELLEAVGGKKIPYSVDTFRCAEPTWDCAKTLNSCGIVACL